MCARECVCQSSRYKFCYAQLFIFTFVKRACYTCGVFFIIIISKTVIIFIAKIELFIIMSLARNINRSTTVHAHAAESPTGALLPDAAVNLRTTSRVLYPRRPLRRSSASIMRLRGNRSKRFSIQRDYCNVYLLLLQKHACRLHNILIISNVCNNNYISHITSLRGIPCVVF